MLLIVNSGWFLYFLRKLFFLSSSYSSFFVFFLLNRASGCGVSGTLFCYKIRESRVFHYCLARGVALLSAACPVISLCFNVFRSGNPEGGCVYSWWPHCPGSAQAYVSPDNSELIYVDNGAGSLKLELSIHTAISLSTSVFSLPWLSSNTFGLEKGWGRQGIRKHRITFHTTQPSPRALFWSREDKKGREEQRQEGFELELPWMGVLCQLKGELPIEDRSPSYRKIGGWMT